MIPLSITVTFTSFINGFCDAVYILHVTQAVVQTGDMWERKGPGMSKRQTEDKAVANQDIVLADRWSVIDSLPYRKFQLCVISLVSFIYL